MNKEPLITFVIPCYNDAEYIEQSINSALNQTYKNIEVIVVDDGSNIKTKRVLEILKPKITKLITQKNKGQSAARNVGIEKAKGDYIVVLDSDDFFEPTFCEKAVSSLFSNESVKIVSSYANLLYQNKASELYKPSGGNLDRMLLGNSTLGSLLFKKVDWELVDGYDESMRTGFEDWEFYIRLLMNGGSAFIIKETLFNYRKRFNSTTTIANKKKYELLNYIYLKHKDVYIKNYDLFIEYLLAKIEHEEKEKLKMFNRLEYKIGFFILKPYRYIKSFFR